jgi:hypothetical protein
VDSTGAAIKEFIWRNELEDDRAPDRDVQEEVVIAAILRAARTHPRFKTIDQWTIVGWLNEARGRGRGGSASGGREGGRDGGGGSFSESIDQDDVETSSDADSDSDEEEEEVEEKEQQAGLGRRGVGETVEAATTGARKRQRQPGAAGAGGV